MYRGQAEQKGLDLIVLNSVDFLVVGDASRIGIVIANLVRNAGKSPSVFSPVGIWVQVTDLEPALRCDQ